MDFYQATSFFYHIFPSFLCHSENALCAEDPAKRPGGRWKYVSISFHVSRNCCVATTTVSRHTFSSIITLELNVPPAGKGPGNSTFLAVHWRMMLYYSEKPLEFEPGTCDSAGRRISTEPHIPSPQSHPTSSSEQSKRMQEQG